MKNKIIILLALLIIAVAAAPVRQGTRVGVIDIEEIVRVHPKAKEYEKEIVEQKRDYEKRMDELTKSMMTISKELKIAAGEKKELATKKLEEIEKEFIELKDEQEYLIKKNYIFKKKELYESVQILARKVAKEKGIELVIKKSDAVYYDEYIDITLDVSKSL